MPFCELLSEDFFYCYSIGAGSVQLFYIRNKKILEFLCEDDRGILGAFLSDNSKCR